MIRAFHDPSTPVGICGCGEVIHPSEDICPDCLSGSADPVNLDPVMIAVLIVCTLGAGILVPLIYSTLKIIGGQ